MGEEAQNWGNWEVLGPWKSGDGTHSIVNGLTYRGGTCYKSLPKYTFSKTRKFGVLREEATGWVLFPLPHRWRETVTKPTTGC